MSKSLLLGSIFILSIYFFRDIVSASSINLSDPNTNVISDPNQEYKVNVKININSPDETLYFLRGVFYKSGKSDYCGYTYNGKNWFKGPYSSSEGWKNFLPVKISSSSANVILVSRFDRDDSGCKENGAYNFKVQRYTVSGSGQFDPQNEQSLNISITIPTPTVAVTATTKPGNTPKPTASPKPSTPRPTITTKPIIKSQDVTGIIIVSYSPALVSDEKIKNTDGFEQINTKSETSTEEATFLGDQINDYSLGSSTAGNIISADNFTKGSHVPAIILLIFGSVFIFIAVLRLIRDIRRNDNA